MFRAKKVYIKVFLGLFFLFAIFLIWGIIYTMKYSNNIPKLTPKKEVFRVSAKECYTASEFVDVECVGEYDLYLLIQETDIHSAGLQDTVNGNFFAGETIYVGDTKGTVNLSITGYGQESEPGNTVEIILVVE